MALILCLETATPLCSVALSGEGKMLFVKEGEGMNDHSASLTLFIEDVLKASGKKLADLQGVCVSMGPGSYTGLRIGVSVAKGLCYSLDIPLLAVSTLASLAAGMQSALGINDQDAFLCPMIDARRMEVYSALYSSRMELVRAVEAQIIEEGSFGEYLADHKVFFGGTGALKVKPLLEHHANARFINNLRPSAAHLAPLAQQKYGKQEFEDVAYFEPFYLKDFIAGKPRVKGL